MPSYIVRKSRFDIKDEQGNTPSARAGEQVQVTVAAENELEAQKIGSGLLGVGYHQVNVYPTDSHSWVRTKPGADPNAEPSIATVTGIKDPGGYRG